MGVTHCLGAFTTIGVVLLFSAAASAQDSSSLGAQTNSALSTHSVTASSASASISTSANKKMLQEATINLQTTVTGNKEQPRVLYILPWQSPAADELDFEPLEQQQKSVFNHIERDELRRELESTSED